MEFESYEYHYSPVLESTLVRFTTLVRSLVPPSSHCSSSRLGVREKDEKDENSVALGLPCVLGKGGVAMLTSLISFVLIFVIII